MRPPLPGSQTFAPLSTRARMYSVTSPRPTRAPAAASAVAPMPASVVPRKLAFASVSAIPVRERVNSRMPSCVSS